MKIVTIFDEHVRPDTTGIYFREAFQEAGHEVEHFSPLRWEDGRGHFDGYDSAPKADLYVHIDDDLAYPSPAHLRPSAYYCIDTHRMNTLVGGSMTRPDKARGFDFVFAAQRDGVEALKRFDLRVSWLPLAYDTRLFRPDPDAKKEYDWSFIGSPIAGRGEACAKLARQFPSCVFGQAYGLGMISTYRHSKIILNFPLSNDVNMRVFEAIGTGGLLVTRATHNGEDELLPDLVTFDGDDELPALVKYWLSNDAERSALAEKQQRAAAAQHTYRNRVEQMLSVIGGG